MRGPAKWLLLCVVLELLLSLHASQNPGQPTVVGMIVQAVPLKGLWRDAETVVYAALTPTFRPKQTLASSNKISIQIFLVSTMDECEQGLQQRREPRALPGPELEDDGGSPLLTHAVAAGTTLREWFGSGLDIVLVLETPMISAFALARLHGVPRLVLVINSEWLDAAALSGLANENVELWTKTRSADAAVRDAARDAGHSMKINYVPWSIPDDVVRHVQPHHPSPGGRITFAMVAGTGGVYNRRGVDIALRAWALAFPTDGDAACSSRLIIASIIPLESFQWDLPLELARHPCVQVVAGPKSRRELLRIVMNADAVLYPSRFEGFGISLLEALHLGLPVLATGAAPMDELVRHGHNGLLLPATNIAQFGLEKVWEVDPKQFAQAILQFGRDASLRRRLRLPQPGLLVARQHAFRMHVQSLLSGTERPRVINLYAGPHPSFRRAELYRDDALQRFGFQVDAVPWHSDIPAAIRRGQQPLFVLTTKPEAEMLTAIRSVTSCPVYMWMWDPIDYAQQRRDWFHKVAPLHDGVFLNEKGRERIWATIGVEAHYIEEGTMAFDEHSDIGLRPISLPQPGVGDDCVFIGSFYPNPNDQPRLDAILSLAAAKVRLALYGPQETWKAAQIVSQQEVYGARVTKIHRRARTALSVSRTQRDVTHYRSERLLDAAGAGACVISEWFHGLEWILPRAALGAVVHHATDLPIAVGPLIRDNSLCEEARSLAAEIVWRTHTWDDSVFKLLSIISSPSSLRAQPLNVRDKTPNSLDSALRIESDHCVDADVCYDIRVAKRLLSVKLNDEAMIHFADALHKCQSHQGIGSVSCVPHMGWLAHAIVKSRPLMAVRTWNTAKRIVGVDMATPAARQTCISPLASQTIVSCDIRLPTCATLCHISLWK